MEWSALVYVSLTVAVVALGLCVENGEYVPAAIEGGKRLGRAPFMRQQARNRIAAAAVYCLLTAVSACRIAVGNDYWVYRDNFKLIAQERHVASEFGFNYIVKWLQQLFGYDNYLPVFAFFSIITVFFFVKALLDQGSYFAFSLYLLMTGGYYFNSLNSVRYYLALAIALYSMKYVLRGEYGKFLLWVLAGTMFHKSVLLVVPVYGAARFLAAVRLKKWHYGLGGIFLLSLIFGQGLYREIIFYFYPFYRGSEFDNGQLSYSNLLKCAAVLALCAVCWRRSLSREGLPGEGPGREDFSERGISGRGISGQGIPGRGISGQGIPGRGIPGQGISGRGIPGQEIPSQEFPEGSRGASGKACAGRLLAKRFYFFLNLLGLMVYCCGTFIPEVSRIGFYMIISQIFLLPELLSEMPRGWLRRVCYIGTVTAFAGYFVLLLRKMYAVDVRLLPYLNWIFN